MPLKKTQRILWGLAQGNPLNSNYLAFISSLCPYILYLFIYVELMNLCVNQEQKQPQEIAHTR